MISKGLITEEQLSQALKRHFQTGKRLGQVLIGMQAVRSEDVGEALERRWAVPYVSLKQTMPSQEALGLFSLDFMQARRILPLERNDGKIRVGMCNPSDHAVLTDLERITGMRPDPCLVLENELEAFWSVLLSQGYREQAV